MRAFLGLVAGLLAFGLFMSVVWAGCSTFLKNNDAYDRGLATALADSTVQARLGAPVEEGWFLNGTVESDAGGTEGAWSTRLRGTRASGTLGIAGRKQGGRWGVTGMTLSVEGDDYAYTPDRGFERVVGGARPDFDILPE